MSFKNSQFIALKVVIVCSFIPLFSSCQKAITQKHFNTVQGVIPSSNLGMVLTHEHIMSNFGKAINETSEYDSLKLFNQVVPYLKKLKALGVNTIFDCTTAYFGRRVDLLESISKASGVQIITNTGFYGAAGDKYIPAFAYNASAQVIAKIWIEEFENGIDSTLIKPGFIKMAFDDGQLPSEIDKKLFEAGILTHLKTGLTMAVHTGGNLEAVALQIKLLEDNKVHPSAWIWTHANKLEDDNKLLELARKGAWISLDGVNENNSQDYIRRLQVFKQNNLLNKVLLSHDGNGFPRGGEIRQFHAIYESLIPELLKSDFTKEEINQLLKENPKAAFSIKIRSLD